jgi:hypothetical protein
MKEEVQSIPQPEAKKRAHHNEPTFEDRPRKIGKKRRRQ